MVQVSGVRPPEPASEASENRRAAASREMTGAGFWTVSGAVVIAIAMRFQHLPWLFVAGAAVLVFGALRFFHGFWRYVRD